jgi:release factor glutamine methyltransferase
MERVALTLQGGRSLSPTDRRRLSVILRKRIGRFPLQYLLGTVDFGGLTLEVSPAVLIPRPETEGLVERVLHFLERGVPATVLEVGTGSGAIALALAAARPELTVWATDVSGAALRVARRNARRLGLTGRVRFAKGDLIAPFETRRPPSPLRVVVSNPPYVARGDDRLPPEVADHEPPAALYAGKTGLAVIRRLLPAAGRPLQGGGLLALEIGEDQGRDVAGLLRKGAGWRDVRIERDLSGRDRYALALKA